MNRQFNVFDALFVMLLFLKISGIGEHIPGYVLLVPYGMEVLFAMINAVYVSLGIRDKIALWLYKWTVIYKVKRHSGKINKQVRKANQRGANPGRHIDPKNFGK